jgi:hypothetical protein
MLSQRTYETTFNFDQVSQNEDQFGFVEVNTLG